MRGGGAYIVAFPSFFIICSISSLDKHKSLDYRTKSEGGLSGCTDL